MPRLLLAATAAALVLSATAPARAEVVYPWCAIMMDESGDSTNCGFTSFQQCQVYISGIGGYCEENPYYAAERPRRPVRRHYRRD
jgi:hypothetical protein